MGFTSHIPRAHQRTPREGSGLSSLRDRNSLLSAWKDQKSSSAQTDKATSVLSQTSSRVAKLSRQRNATNGMHPFKIYQFPSSQRVFQNADDWQRFKVRGGNVLFGTNHSSRVQPALGTDQSSYIFGNNFGDELLRSQTLPTTNAQIAALWNEIVVPADGNQYYFWYSVCLNGLLSSGSNHGLLFGLSSTTATSMETGQTGLTDPHWTTFPYDDPYRKVIGSVLIPTATVSPLYIANVPYVTQKINGDIEIANAFTVSVEGPPVVWRSLYDAARYYFVGDQVYRLTTTGGKTIRSVYVYAPDAGSAYLSSFGPIAGVDPNTNTPDPWQLVSKSFTDADYVTGAYDSSKYYTRTP